MPQNTLCCPENPLSLLPYSSFHMKNLTVNSSHLSRIRSSQLFIYSTKFFEMLFDLPKILYSLFLLKFLPACIMVNTICRVVFVDIPCHCHFEPNDSMCVNARNHQLILINYLSGSDVITDMSWFSANQTLINYAPKSIQLTHT
jgi:hypothetical protein